MAAFNRKEHWENTYNTKKLDEVSWYQPIPHTSLDLIHELGLAKDDAIIDIGGGDSFLVDYLLEDGYSNVTVLDISAKAIERAKKRLGPKADQVEWIVSDITEFTPSKTYKLWHDRAAFHFLRDQEDIAKYKEHLKESLQDHSYVIMGTFSENGPLKCSGIEIKQYSEETLNKEFGYFLSSVKSFTIDHNTPFETIQNFVFCCFKRGL